ncbi:MFS transporter [Pseudomonas sp. App30]|uniref:MFS transporter n=1 Tax=Pseudomonas sp. App30 TaxID=3068990 RepID=UPI003A808D4D
MQMRSWWPRQLLLGWLNLVLTAPLVYLFIGLPLVMREHGWSGTQIGLMQLTGLPALAKFLLAAPLERWPLGRASYRNWALLLGLGYVASLLVLAANDLGSTPYGVLFGLAMLVSLLGTCADLPINALAIRLLPEAERLRAGAVRSAAVSVGAIVGGGLMLMLHSQLGWAWPLIVLALVVLSGVLVVPLLPEPALDGSATQAPTLGANHWLAWFAMPGQRRWALLLVLYYPLIGAVWVFLKPLMLDQGFAPEHIARIVGVGGGVAAALASLAGGYVSRRCGTQVALPLFAACNLLALGLMALVTGLAPGATALTVAALVVALMMGASGGLVFGLMMDHARPGLAALDYGIQSSLFVVGRTLLPMLAGVLLDHVGYAGLFACLLAGLALMLTWLLAGGQPLRPVPQARPTE